MYIKSPFNWVGNKVKFISIINNLVKNKSYNMIVDLFMGSGNILFNINSPANLYIGNDKQKLLPKIYSILKNQSFLFDDIDNILNNFNRFSTKESYYIFRDYWNSKYLSDNFDRAFVLETALLLKMCSNSMIRFNKDREFNQGFRGLGEDKEFFKKSMLESILSQLNNLNYFIKDKNIKFLSKDFKQYKDEESSDRLLILDPPYALGDKGMYERDFSEQDNGNLLGLIENTRNDFIYFNYLEHDGMQNILLNNLIKREKFEIIEIGNGSVISGQGKTGKEKIVKEVIITNITEGKSICH